MADALDLGSSGRPCRFKSCYPHKQGLSRHFECLGSPCFLCLTAILTATGRKKGKIANFVNLVKYLNIPFFRFSRIMEIGFINERGENFMQILFSEKYCSSKHTIKVNTKNPWLKNQIEPEKAKKEKANIYVSPQMHYVVGREDIKFLFLEVASIPFYKSDDKKLEYVYRVDVLVGDNVYRAQLSKDEYSREKWLGNLGTKEILVISRTKYQQIISEIIPEDTNAIFFDAAGLHKVGNQYFYVGSDCAITKDGKRDDVVALQGGFDLGLQEDVDNAEIAEKVVRYNCMNLRIFYPFHCIAVMTVMGHFLDELGERAGMTLWVDGKVASGKTELAVFLGNFFKRGNSRSDMISHLHTTKIKYKNLEPELIKYQNGIFVLDDVKKEESSQSKYNVKQITDFVVRSVYTGMVSGVSIHTNAIITGEYFREQESTISRLIYLNVGDFVQNRGNSEALACIQEDNNYFNRFMCSFIAWFLRKTDDEALQTELEGKLAGSREEAEERLGNFEKELRPRMIEICSLLFFSTEMIRDYLIDSLCEKDKEQVQTFYEQGKTAVVQIVMETWIKGLDYKPILDMAFNNILRKLKIKDCRYGVDYLNARTGEISYCFAMARENKDGISFTTWVSRKEKLWLLKLNKECAGILINQGKEDILLMNKDIICTEIREEIRAQKDNWHIVFYESDYTDEKILTGLLNKQRLLAHKRSDDTFDKIINYPMIEYDDESGEIGIFDKKKVQMVRVYIDDEQKVLEYFAELKKEPLDAWCHAREKIRKNGGGGAEDIELNKTLNDLNKFLDLK